MSTRGIQIGHFARKYDVIDKNDRYIKTLIHMKL